MTSEINRFQEKLRDDELLELTLPKDNLNVKKHKFPIKINENT